MTVERSMRHALSFSCVRRICKQMVLALYPLLLHAVVKVFYDLSLFELFSPDFTLSKIMHASC